MSEVTTTFHSTSILHLCHWAGNPIKRRLSIVGIWRGIAYSKNALSAYCLQRLAFNRATRRRHIKRNRQMKKKTNELSALDINAVQSRMTEFENWRSQIVTSSLPESELNLALLRITHEVARKSK